MANENEDQQQQDGEQSETGNGNAGVQPAQPGPGVPPITSAPVQGQPASAFVQPAVTYPDGDPRFAIKDAGTPYVVGLGHVASNPTQYRNDQEQAEKDREENKDSDTDENNSNNNS